MRSSLIFPCFFCSVFFFGWFIFHCFGLSSEFRSGLALFVFCWVCGFVLWFRTVAGEVESEEHHLTLPCFEVAL